MEVSLEHFKDLEKQGLTNKGVYQARVRVFNEEWKKGDIAVITEGEYAGSIGYVSYMNTNLVNFPEDETHTTYELEDECSLTFIHKVGAPQSYGWKLIQNCKLAKVTIDLFGDKFDNMEDINQTITEACIFAISGKKYLAPYEMDINPNVEVLPLTETYVNVEIEA